MKRLIGFLLLLSLLHGGAFAQPDAASPSPVPAPSYTPTAAELTIPPRLVIAPPMTVPADVPPRAMTVQEAVAIALHHQPALGVAQGNLQSARGRTKEAVAALHPNVSLSATNTPVNSIVLNSGGSTASTFGSSFFATTGLTASLSGRQLLFDFDKTHQGVEQARGLQRAAGASLAQTHNDVVLQVEQAFYASLQAERLIHVNETDVQNQREHLQETQALYRSGVGKPADVIRAQNAVATALINLKQAQGDADDTRMNLALAMGLDPRTPLLPGPGDLPVPADTDLPALVEQALGARPEVRAARAQVEAARSGLAAAQHNNAPSISATASVGTQPNPLSSSQLDLAAAGLTAQWNFGDGGLTAGKVEEARGALETAQSQLTAASTSVVNDVAQAFVNLRTAEEKLRLSNVAVSTAEENLRLSHGRYAAGLGLSIDVLDAESALLVSLTTQVNQQAEVDLTRAALAHALGDVVQE